MLVLQVVIAKAAVDRGERMYNCWPFGPLQQKLFVVEGSGIRSL